MKLQAAPEEFINTKNEIIKVSLSDTLISLINSVIILAIFFYNCTETIETLVKTRTISSMKEKPERRIKRAA